jgi:beta-1,4-N-acetylglucosaminyltransferase
MTLYGSSAGADEERCELLLVCSGGGHLHALVALREAWAGFSRSWVTYDKEDARSLLAGERVLVPHGPSSRYYGLRAVRSFVRNVFLAWRVIGRVRPRVILTTGASVAVPFAWVGRLRGARVVFVESFTRIESPSLSCRLVTPVAARVYTQWPELAARIPRARYVGATFSWQRPPLP